MERSPIKNTEIKYLISSALTDKINDRDVYKYLTYQFDSKRTKCTTSYDLCFPKIEK